MSFRFREVNSFFELMKEVERFVKYNNKQNQNSFIGFCPSYNCDGIRIGCANTFHLSLTPCGQNVNITFEEEDDALTMETDLEHAFLFVKGLLEDARF